MTPTGGKLRQRHGEGAGSCQTLAETNQEAPDALQAPAALPTSPRGAGTGIPVEWGGGTHDTQGRHRGTRGYPHPSLPPAPFPQQLICNVNEGVRPCKITDGNEPPLPGVGGATLQRGPVGGGHPWVGVQAYPEVLGEVGHLGVGGGGHGRRRGDPQLSSRHPGDTPGPYWGGWVGVWGGARQRPPHTPHACTLHWYLSLFASKAQPRGHGNRRLPRACRHRGPLLTVYMHPGGGGGGPEGPGGAAGAALGPDTRYAAK